MYYLIEHNRTAKTTDWFEYSDYQEARRACFEKEQQYVLENKDEIEVVIFETDSLEDLKQTHSRYFVESEKDSDTTDTVIAVDLVTLAVRLYNPKIMKQTLPAMKKSVFKAEEL